MIESALISAVHSINWRRFIHPVSLHDGLGLTFIPTLNDVSFPANHSIIIIKQTKPRQVLAKFTQEEIDKINSKLNTPEDALRWAFDTLHDKVAKASSFGAEDAVITDMMIKLNPKARFFTLDTGRLNQETYDVMDRISKKYNIHFEVMFPDTEEVQQMVRIKGINLFYESIENRKLCCEIRKVKPLNKILSTLDGWITGLRHDQNENRQKASMVEIDKMHGEILKINPLIDWTWEQTLSYVKEHKLPYNKLLDMGYTSIGCEPCTRAIKPGEDLRAGRWWWESDTHKECGLHMDHKTT